MVGASLLFATMGVCVKLASTQYTAGELVMYRGAIGALMIAALARVRGETLATTLPGMHATRAIVGVVALVLWFYAIGGLPLATAITLNYMSSVWMAVFLFGGAVALGGARIDSRLIATVLVGFAGVALVLQPTLAHDQYAFGVAGLLSGMVAALAYLQVVALGRAGEPETRVVFYFSLGSVIVGAALSAWSGFQAHTWQGVLLIVAIGVLATGAQWMMTRAFAVGRPLVNASLQYLGIVFSTVYGVTLFGEPLPWTTIAGIALIVVAGLVAARLRAQATQREDVNPGVDS